MPETSWKSGQLFGEYQILDELGRGGMGVVYQAHESALDRLVALKVLPSHYAKDAEFVRRLKEEARAAAQLNHPNIVKIHAVGECQGLHYICMQYVRGRSLHELIREKGPVGLTQALACVRQIADGLTLAHEHKLIHRDIKPHNIMIDERGRALLMDFGLARPMQAATMQTAQGVLVGTPLYMSPEQVRGSRLDGRTDLYSLGITLYEMLTGCPPFEAPSAPALMYQIIHEPLPNLHNANREATPEVAYILAKMTAKERQERYASAGHLCKDLDAVAAGRRPSHALGVTGAMQQAPDLSRNIVDDLLNDTNVMSVPVPKARRTLWEIGCPL